MPLVLAGLGLLLDRSQAYVSGPLSASLADAARALTDAAQQQGVNVAAVSGCCSFLRGARLFMGLGCTGLCAQSLDCTSNTHAAQCFTALPAWGLTGLTAAEWPERPAAVCCCAAAGAGTRELSKQRGASGQHPPAHSQHGFRPAAAAGASSRRRCQRGACLPHAVSTTGPVWKGCCR
jgi:hypothetical protein